MTVRPIDDALRLFASAAGRCGRDHRALEHLADPLRQVCQCARDERIPPEKVLVDIKRVLDGLSLYDLDGAGEYFPRSRIISFVIDAYYADGSAGPKP